MKLPKYSQTTIGDRHFRSWKGFIEVVPHQEITSEGKSVKAFHPTFIFPKPTTSIGFNQNYLFIGDMKIEMTSGEDASKAYRWLGERMHI